MPLGRAYLSEICNTAKSGVRDTGIRIAIADDVKCIEGIESKSDRVFPGDTEVLERRHIHIDIARAAD